MISVRVVPGIGRLAGLWEFPLAGRPVFFGRLPV
jgi:hypothetical protein